MNLCKCGCGYFVISEKAIFLRGHNSKLFGPPNKGQKINRLKNFCLCGCNQLCKNKYIDGHFKQRHAWNKGLTKEIDSRLIGHKAWNKGLGKKNESKIIQLCMCGCKKFANPGRKFLTHHNFVGALQSHVPHAPWNKGLTKNEDGRMKTIAIKMLGNQNGAGPRSPETKEKLKIIKTGQKHSEQTRKLISITKTGNSPAWNKGIKLPFVVWNKGLTKDMDSRVAKLGENTSKGLKLFFSNVNNKTQQQRAARRGLGIKPNKPETILLELFSIFDIPFKYVGDGSFWIEGKNPDFIDERNKRIIEFQGCYFHSCKFCNKNDGLNKNTFPERQILFKKHGYESIEIWEHELKDLDALSKKLLIFQMCNILNRAASPGLFLGA